MAQTQPATESVDHVSSMGILAALVAVSTWGLTGVVAKHIDMGGLAIGAYRFLLYGLAGSLIVGARKSPITKRVMIASLPGGVALGFDIALFFSAIKLTTVANATVIGALQPVIVAVVAAKLYNERIKRSDIGFAAIAIVGVVVVIFGASGSAAWSLRGDLLAVGALFAWAAYFVFSKRTSGVITSSEYTIGAALWAGIINVPLAIAFGQSLGFPTFENWLWLIGMAAGAGLLGHAAMNWAIQQIPLWLSSTFTLLVPVASTIAAWAFLGESLSAVQVIAMAVVLAALVGVVTGQGSIGSRPRPLRR